MSLLREIQDAAATDTVPVAVLLRKCKILAYRLSSSQLADWVDLELNGYPESENLEVPQYRIIPYLECRGNFQGPRGSYINSYAIPQAAIPQDFKDVVRPWYSAYSLRQGVGEYEHILSKSGGETLRLPWPSNLTAAVGGSLIHFFVLVDAWSEISVMSLVGVLENVRNKVLNFALDMEKENPNAGEADPGTNPVPEQTVSHVFNQNFYGGVGNVAAASHDFSQQAIVGASSTPQNLPADLAALAVELPKLRDALVKGAEPEQLAAAGEVRKAELEAEKPEPDPSKIKEYLAKAGKVAGDVAIKLGVAVAAKAIEDSVGM